MLEIEYTVKLYCSPYIHVVVPTFVGLAPGSLSVPILLGSCVSSSKYFINGNINGGKKTQLSNCK